MRVILAVTRGNVLGGAQNYVRDLARRLVSDGHEVLVVTGPPGLLNEELERSGVAVRSLPTLVRQIHPVHDVRTIVQLRSIIQEFSPDLVVAVSSKAGVVARIAAKLAGVPCVFTNQGWAFNPSEPEPIRTFYRWMERAMAPLSAKIICVSHHSLSFGASSGIRPDRMVTIHNAIADLETRTAPRVSDGAALRVICVARFALPKDQPTLIRAVAAVPGIHLDLVGDGPEENAAKRLVEELGIGDRVAFLGPRTDVPELLRTADLFALCSRSEGFPISTLEAMRSGLPVIVSNVGGAAEAVAEGETGFVVHDNSVELWTTRLREMAEDRDRLITMGVAGRERYLRLFTFDQMYADTIKIYAQAARKPLSANRHGGLGMTDGRG
jgi:glycosyltransferase involved in cell wall biosynthesis